MNYYVNNRMVSKLFTNDKGKSTDGRVNQDQIAQGKKCEDYGTKFETHIPDNYR